jgi:CRISPR/Cas system-associated endonuclease Cas3-HD
MRRVLSYYEPPVTEYLSEHINSCIYLLEKLERSRIGRAGTSLNENFVNGVRLSVVFHDLGKTFYQKNPTHFTGHEIFSAYILSEFRKSFIRKKLDNFKGFNILKPAIFAVAFHHHPMDIGKRLEKISWIKLYPNFLEDLQNELLFLKDGALYEEERDLLNSVISELKSKIERDFIKIEDIKLGFHEICKDLYNYIISGKERDIILKKLSYLTLVSLVSVDYISASERGGKKTRFGNVMDEFYKLYLDI